ncbi:MAG TPA: hypothetical protein VK066_22815 [Chloroflexota bacterium]|nr:hypothetical protein [Chloroflexota bacterium]
MAAMLLVGAGNTRSLSLAVMAVEIVVGLLLLSDAWGLRRRLPSVNSESKRQAAVGWIALVVGALLVRQVAACWS